MLQPLFCLLWEASSSSVAAACATTTPRCTLLLPQPGTHLVLLQPLPICRLWPYLRLRWQLAHRCHAFALFLGPSCGRTLLHQQPGTRPACLAASATLCAHAPVGLFAPEQQPTAIQPQCCLGPLTPRCGQLGARPSLPATSAAFQRHFPIVDFASQADATQPRFSNNLSPVWSIEYVAPPLYGPLTSAQCFGPTGCATCPTPCHSRRALQFPDPGLQQVPFVPPARSPT